MVCLDGTALGTTRTFLVRREKKVCIAIHRVRLDRPRTFPREWCVQVCRAVEREWSALEAAAESARNDREVVLFAVTRGNGLALRFASDELRNDDALVCAAVTSNGFARTTARVSFFSRTARYRALVCLSLEAFVRVCFFSPKPQQALQFASVRLRADRACCLAAVRSQPLALQFASDERRDDRSVVVAACAPRPRRSLLRVSGQNGAPPVLRLSLSLVPTRLLAGAGRRRVGVRVGKGARGPTSNGPVLSCFTRIERRTV